MVYWVIYDVTHKPADHSENSTSYLDATEEPLFQLRPINAARPLFATLGRFVS
jgi:hypothetical protein